MTITQWHVPVDDTKHYWYAIFTSFGQPVNKDEMRRQRLELYELHRRSRARTKEQRLRFRSARAGARHLHRHGCRHQRARPVGLRVDGHDPGLAPAEHLGQSDKAISAYRRMRRQAIDDTKSGGKPLMVLGAADAPKLTGPAAIDGVGLRPVTGRAIGRRPTPASARRRAGPTAADRMASRPARALSFVDRHELWSAEQRRAVAAVEREIKRRKLRDGAFQLLRSARRAARQDSRRGRGRQGDARGHCHDLDVARQGHLAPHCVPGVLAGWRHGARQRWRAPAISS